MFQENLNVLKQRGFLNEVTIAGLVFAVGPSDSIHSSCKGEGCRQCMYGHQVDVLAVRAKHEATYYHPLSIEALSLYHLTANEYKEWEREATQKGAPFEDADPTEFVYSTETKRIPEVFMGLNAYFVRALRMDKARNKIAA